MGIVLELFWIILANAGIGLWVAGAVFFLVYLGVFSGKPLAAAPARESMLSLPVAGAVIVFYLLVQYATVMVAMGVGAVPKAMFMPKAAGTQAGTAPVFSVAERTVTGNALAIPITLVTVVVVVVFLSRLFKERMTGWGLHGRQLPRGVAQGLVGFGLVYPLLIVFIHELSRLYEWGGYQITDHQNIQALQQTMHEGPSAWRMFILCFVPIVIAPLGEEFFFRGILQTALIQKGWGLIMPQGRGGQGLSTAYRPSARQRWMAIVVASVAFTSLHQLDQMPIIFILSLGLGYVYERTGNLWAPIILHVAFNSTSISTFLAGG